MKTKMFKVIWFDDEHSTLELIKESAFLGDIELVGFTNGKSGMDELKFNLDQYDAAILDGKFFRKPGQNFDAVDDMALFEVATFLESLKDRKHIPWFILSGQISFVKGKNQYAEEFKNNKVYDKTNSQDIQALWNDIKTACYNQPEFQIRHQYATLFAQLEEMNFGPDAEKHMVQILTSVHYFDTSLNDELYFTQIRIILEKMFRHANSIGLLHDKCLTSGKVNLTESSLFLAGEATKHLNIKCTKSHFNKIITDSVKNILFITGAASHTIDPDIKGNIDIEEYRKWIKTPYLLYSLTFQLIDILLWYKKYASENSDLLNNKSLWAEIVQTNNNSSLKGSVTKIDLNNGFGTFKPDDGSPTLSITPRKVKEHNLKVDSVIEVITMKDRKDDKKKLIDKITIITL